MRLFTHNTLISGFSCLLLIHQLLTADASLGSQKNEFLDMDISQLMDITITSVSKKPQALSTAPAAVFVITQEEIKRSGVTSIADALALSPGLHVARISASKWSVSTRGFSGYTSNKLLILIDGRSVFSPAYSGVFWDMQNTLLEDVDRIEVIRGPGATLWGANAVNGVINIITKHSSSTVGTLVRGGMGDQEKVMAALRHGVQLNEATSGRVYLSYNDRNSNILEDDKQDGNDSWKTIQGGFRLDGQPTRQNTWTFQGELYNNQEDQVIFPFWSDSPPYVSTHYGDVDVLGSHLLGRLQHFFSDDSSLTLQTYYDYYDRQEDYYQFTYHTLDFDVQFQTLAGKRNSVTIGGGYRLIDGSFDPAGQLSLSGHTDNLFNAFIQDEITIFDNLLWMTLGTKWEYNDHTSSEWQPSLRFLLKPDESQSLWAAVSRAVRTPSALEKSGSIRIGIFPSSSGPHYFNFKGNPDFQSEELIAYEAGYRWQLDSTLSFDIATFFNEYDDLYTSRTASTSPTETNLEFANGMVGESYGIEAVVDWRALPWLSFVGTYSYVYLDLTDTVDETSTFDEALEFSYPQHMLSLRSSVDMSREWQLNLWCRYVDSTMARNSVDLYRTVHPVDSYTLFDANILWKPTRDLEIMLAGQNLLNGSNVQFISEFQTPPVEIERGFYLKLTWKY